MAARRSGRAHWLVLLLLVLSLSGCGATRGTRPIAAQSGFLPTGEDWVRSELLFGRSKPDGSVVSDAEWQAFVDREVTPRFPDGLTIIEASGQFRTRTGQVAREATKLLLILHPPDARSRGAIEEIRARYKERFDQDSVLLISSLARVSF